MEKPYRDSHRFGHFDVLPAQREVLVAGEPAALGARAFDLLLVLIASRERMLSKDELLALVWPGIVVEENNLTVQISALRKLLGADAITTIAGRGYRFTATVIEALQHDTPSPSPAAPPVKTTTATFTGGHVPAPLNTLIGRADAVQETLQLLEAT